MALNAGPVIRRALFVGTALAVTALPVTLTDDGGWITLNSASATHDNSSPKGTGHGGGGGGGSGGASTPGGGGSGGAGAPPGSGGAAAPPGGGGAPSPGGGGASSSSGGGRNSSDGIASDQLEAELESFVEGAHTAVDAQQSANGPAVLEVIGAVGTTVLSAEEELALIASGWN